MFSILRHVIIDVFREEYPDVRVLKETRRDLSEFSLLFKIDDNIKIGPSESLPRASLIVRRTKTSVG